LRSDGDSAFVVSGLSTAAIGELAARHALVLHELTPVRASLEEAFMDLTRDEVEFRSIAPLSAPCASRK
jgi:ABC-2 type transport system ATP-binding protein